MPEGHTVHRRARDHTKWFRDQSVRLSSPQGRFDDEARALDGESFREAFAIGKHLIYRFDRDHIHIHLGLFGKFRAQKIPAGDPRGAVRLRVVGRDRAVDLIGPIKCERFTDVDLVLLRARLGPDPLDPRSDVALFVDALRRRRSPIGVALLDQSVVAGLGNVYRAELLHRAQMNPFTPANQLTTRQAESMFADMRDLLAIGVKYDRIITVDRSEVDRPFSRLRRGERLNVYGRARCRRCDSPVRREDLQGRNLHWCVSCQGGSR